MSTLIEWTDEAWNPVIGCTRVSDGCAHCYAFALHDRRHIAWKRGRWPDAPTQYQQPFSKVQLMPERLGLPLRWRTPKRVFVNSLSDLFHEDVPDEFIDRVFAVMAICAGERYRCRGPACKHDDDSRGCWSHGDGREEARHIFQVLTKRPARMCEYIQARSRWRGGIEEALNGPEWPVHYDAAAEIVGRAGWPLPNVWLGVSAENQRMLDQRVPYLLATPTVVRFLSAEPLLGPLDLSAWIPGSLSWVICGGESGPRRRPMDPAWARGIRDQCAAAGVPFFMKQMGGVWAGNALGELPEDLRIREYPCRPRC